MEPPKHQGDRAESRNRGIIGGLYCEGEDGGTETSEQRCNYCRSRIQNRTVQEFLPLQPLRPLQ